MTRLTVQDQDDIKDLLTRYTYILDLQSVEPRDAFLSLFADDAVLDSPHLGRFVGKCEIGKFADLVVQATKGQRWRHILHNLHVMAEEENAILHALVLAVVTRLETDPRSEMVFAGRYECAVVRVGGQWKLKSRMEFADL